MVSGWCYCVVVGLLLVVGGVAAGEHVLPAVVILLHLIIHT